MTGGHVGFGDTIKAAFRGDKFIFKSAEQSRYFLPRT